MCQQPLEPAKERQEKRAEEQPSGDTRKGIRTRTPARDSPGERYRGPMLAGLALMLPEERAVLGQEGNTVGPGPTQGGSWNEQQSYKVHTGAVRAPRHGSGLQRREGVHKGRLNTDLLRGQWEAYFSLLKKPRTKMEKRRARVTLWCH